MLKKILPLVLVSLLLAATTSAYSPTTAVVGDYVTKSIGTNLGSITTSKTQSSTTELFISNNPESMNSSTIFANKASVLGYTNLVVGKTYRIFVAHTNNYGSNLNFALMIKGSTAGSFTLTKKAVSTGSSFAVIGVNSARDFLNSSYNQTLTIPTSWTYFDGPYLLTSGSNIQGWWEITVNSGSGVALGVTAAPTSNVNDIQTSWRTGATQDAPKQSMANESHTAVGLFRSIKTVNMTVDLDLMGLNSYYWDKMGHYFGSDSPTSDASGFDGWVGEAFAGSGQGGTYLPGNYGVIYRYNVTFKSSSGYKGAVYIGRNPSQGGTTGAIGLVLKPSGSSAISLGPISSADVTKAWLVVKDTSGTPITNVTFDILVPGNIEMPYMVYFERVS